MSQVKALAVFAALMFAGEARADWYNFTPPGSVDGKGILQDVLSRCGAAGRQRGYDPDLVTYCHEATHQLNSRIRNSMRGTGKDNAFYVGAGRCVVFPEPRVTLEIVGRYVTNYRNSTFELYFVKMRQHWNDQPLYVLDEFSAYANGLQASQELRVDGHGTLDRCIWFSHYADALLEAIKRHDPQYPKVAELGRFIAWQKDRVAEMSGGPIDVTVKNVDNRPVQQTCFGGNCQGGMCYPPNCGPAAYPQQVYQPQPSRPQPVATPIPAPPPTTVPSTPMKGCDCPEKWASFNTWKGEVNTQLNQLSSQSTTITNINQRMTAIEQAEQPKVPTVGEVADEVLRNQKPFHIRVRNPKSGFVTEYSAVTPGSYVTIDVEPTSEPAR